MAKAKSKSVLRRYLAYPLEAAALYLVFALVRLLPVDTASNLGGWIGRTLGPRVGVTRVARRNLALAFPEKSAAARETIVREMWDNLGRTAAEYAHLGTITERTSGRVEVVDPHHVLVLAEGRGGMVASAHLANWEVMPVVAGRYGVDPTIVVREPNNPLVRAIVDRWRGVAGGRRIPKGVAGARAALTILKDGGVLGVLCDQKMNRGLSLPFFGHDAMTASSPAQMALKVGCPIVPTRIERLGPGRFRVVCQAPLELPRLGDRQAEIRALTLEINRVIEAWIRERPGEWLWLHRRWPREIYREGEAARVTH
jgi:KDO2-lipid IV(A) lauroyltransferase